MSVKPSLAASLLALQGLASFIDQGSNNATFVFYSDTKPTDMTVAANDSAKLVILTLPKPCTKQVLSDGIELYPTSSNMAIQTGTAVWARLFNGNGLAVVDFVMGSDITLNTYEIVTGGTQILDSIILKPDL
ncbi:hypothetical protein ACX1NX_02830 [Acinetobacter sp. ANC 5383]